MKPNDRKKYIFLTFAVTGVGGTQIYLRNKLLYLRSRGWDVRVITTEPGDEVLISELLPYKDSVMPELLVNPYVYTRRTRLRLLERMRGIIGDTSEGDVVESNFFQVTLWGELFAASLNIRHFVFFIQEDYRLSSVKYLRFYDFKYRRGELAGNTDYALRQLFSGYREIPDDKRGKLSAECSNAVEDCDYPLIAGLPAADYRIGSIGRVNKPFVLRMIDDIAAFAGKHGDKTFLLVMMGGSPDSRDYDNIISHAGKASNLKVIITGPIYPIPARLLDRMDVFISSAGAADTSANAGHVTISIDANDFEPIGILRYTASETVHRNPSLPHRQTAELLEDILIHKKYAQLQPVDTPESESLDAVFNAHIAYLNAAEPALRYYDVSGIVPKKTSLMYLRLKAQISSLFR